MLNGKVGLQALQTENRELVLKPRDTKHAGITLRSWGSEADHPNEDNGDRR